VEENGQRYRIGSWTVRPGQVKALIEAWQEFTEWVLEKLPDGGEAFLLQDLDDPHDFISYAALTMPEKTEELLASAESASRMRGVMEMCERVQPHRMRVVVRSSARPSEDGAFSRALGGSTFMMGN
jgi:hypothetical protein